MIYNFKVENFYSIRDMQELNFEANKKYDDSVSGSLVETYINNISCLMGNNASGKTNLLKALTFFIWFTEQSYHKLPIDEGIPYEKHMLSQDKPTKFEIIFDNKDHLYKLELELDKDKVISETLGIKVKRGFTKIYSVKRNNNKFEIINYNDDYLSTLNKDDKNRFEEKTTSSFFSFLANLAYLSKLELKSIVPDLQSNVDYMGMKQCGQIVNCLKCTKLFEENSELIQLSEEYINKFDLGITEISLNKNSNLVIEDSKGKAKQVKMLQMKHSDGKQSFDLPLLEESSGTVSALLFLCSFLQVIKSGGLFILDEIETSLHPSILRKLIGLFGNKDINTYNAQLIFSTHQPLFLNDRLKSQIYLVEKENMLDTEVFRLDDVQPAVRNDENFFMKYIAGEYGAVPNLGV